MSWQDLIDGHVYGRLDVQKYVVQLLLDGVQLHKTFHLKFKQNVWSVQTKTDTHGIMGLKKTHNIPKRANGRTDGNTIRSD